MFINLILIEFAWQRYGLLFVTHLHVITAIINTSWFGSIINWNQPRNAIPFILPHWVELSRRSRQEMEFFIPLKCQYNYLYFWYFCHRIYLVLGLRRQGYRYLSRHFFNNRWNTNIHIFRWMKNYNRHQKSKVRSTTVERAWKNNKKKKKNEICQKIKNEIFMIVNSDDNLCSSVFMEKLFIFITSYRCYQLSL